MDKFLKDSGIFCISSWDRVGGQSVHFNGICYLENCIIFGQEGFEKYLAENINVESLVEGRFTAVYPLSSDFKDWCICNDETGQGLIFFYNYNENWAVSNSFLYLVEFLNKKNVKLSFNISSVMGFSALHTTTQQPISHSTLVSEVRLLPLNEIIHIKDLKLNFVKRAVKPKYSYEEGLVLFRDSWVNRLNALSNCFSGGIHCDLTGGYDSRTIFGLVLSSDIDLKSLNVRSQIGKVEDFNVATRISDSYKFSLNSGHFSKKKVSNEKLFELWRYGNLGIYFPVYFNACSYSQSTDNIVMHGAGGEALRDKYYNDTPMMLASKLSKRLNKIYEPKLIESFFNEFLKGAAEAGFSPNQEFDSSYYNFYRSRYHFGRNQYRNLNSTLITPLASSLLHQLKSDLGKNAPDTLIYSDLMLLCDHRLIDFDFDDPSRNFSREQIENSIFYKKSPRINHQAISIYTGNIELDEMEFKNTVTPNQILCDEISKFGPILSKMCLITESRLEILKKDILARVDLTKNLRMASYLLSVATIRLLCNN
ncbi:hypothetical protein [Acinetobacter sp.]|uniref:hypothetical protein n=1 Tax=Acinetobacter sp. TaxID=472 RepID=UPI0028A936C7|nr:hypothetical protein [Acinetobacter sp.]